MLAMSGRNPAAHWGWNATQLQNRQQKTTKSIITALTKKTFFSQGLKYFAHETQSTATCNTAYWHSVDIIIITPSSSSSLHLQYRCHTHQADKQKDCIITLAEIKNC
jgi:hypothetical protein